MSVSYIRDSYVWLGMCSVDRLILSALHKARHGRICWRSQKRFEDTFILVVVTNQLLLFIYLLLSCCAVSIIQMDFRDYL